MGWAPNGDPGRPAADGYFEGLPMNAYNAVTGVEIEASRRLVETMRGRPGGKRLEQVLWAASGSEAVQKALWACLHRDESRDVILAIFDPCRPSPARNAD